MIEYIIRCKDCLEEFDAEVPEMPGKYAVKYDHCVLKHSYFINDKKVSKTEYDRIKPENRIKEAGIKCPKCLSTNLEKLLSFDASYIFSDNITPNSGFSKVDKRHQEGMYWDSPKSILESKEVNREMKNEGYKKALKMAQHDEETLAKQYKKVSEKEAKEYLSNPNRKGDVHIVKYPDKPAG